MIETSMYGIINGGINKNADVALAIIGMTQNDFNRFRDAWIEEERICVLTRGGGNNRENYDSVKAYLNPYYIDTEDDDSDSTYCYYYFSIPDKFKGAIKALIQPHETMDEKLQKFLEEIQQMNNVELHNDARTKPLMDILERVDNKRRKDDLNGKDI